VLRLECTVCKYKHQVPLKRCKHFELGGDKKTKVSWALKYDRPKCHPINASLYDTYRVLLSSSKRFFATYKCLVIGLRYSICPFATGTFIISWRRRRKHCVRKCCLYGLMRRNKPVLSWHHHDWIVFCVVKRCLNISIHLSFDNCQTLMKLECHAT
jgi:hypothetical protein